MAQTQGDHGVTHGGGKAVDAPDRDDKRARGQLTGYQIWVHI